MPEALTKIYKRVPIDKICTQCPLNKQYMKAGTKTKKVGLDDTIYPTPSARAGYDTRPNF